MFLKNKTRHFNIFLEDFSEQKQKQMLMEHESSSWHSFHFVLILREIIILYFLHWHHLSWKILSWCHTYSKEFCRRWLFHEQKLVFNPWEVALLRVHYTEMAWIRSFIIYLIIIKVSTCLFIIIISSPEPLFYAILCNPFYSFVQFKWWWWCLSVEFPSGSPGLNFLFVLENQEIKTMNKSFRMLAKGFICVKARQQFLKRKRNPAGIQFLTLQTTREQFSPPFISFSVIFPPF